MASTTKEYMNSESLSDDDLIRGCRENNRKCQEMLYRRYARAMFNLCLIYEQNRDNAKDILQDAFIKIFGNIKSFNGQICIGCWMKKIITNTAIDYYRKHYREANFIPIGSIPHLLSNDESVASIMNTKDIIALVNRLPRGARMIFQLHAIEGYSHKEIAKLMHISEGTSKSQINRAKHLLKQWMDVYEKNYNIIEGSG